jgi:hypothetical protein
MSLDSSGAESSKLNNPQSGQTNLDQSGASNMATAGSNGGLSKDEATRYIANFAMVDKNSDGQISQTEFQEGCERVGSKLVRQAGSLVARAAPVANRVAKHRKEL